MSMDITEYMKREAESTAFCDAVQDETDRLRRDPSGWDQFYEFADESKMRAIEFYLADMQKCVTLSEFLEVKSDLQSVFESVMKSIIRERLK